jgi:hypothetical protein
MSDWYVFKNGESIGQAGSESGRILRDDEHEDRARVTLEHGTNNRFTITCGIYGWMVHTRFFDSETAALMGFDETKEELATILALIPIEDEANDENMRVAQQAIDDYVERCP